MSRGSAEMMNDQIKILPSFKADISHFMRIYPFTIILQKPIYKRQLNSNLQKAASFKGVIFNFSLFPVLIVK